MSLSVSEKASYMSESLMDQVDLILSAMAPYLTEGHTPAVKEALQYVIMAKTYGEPVSQTGKAALVEAIGTLSKELKGQVAHLVDLDQDARPYIRRSVKDLDFRWLFHDKTLPVVRARQHIMQWLLDSSSVSEDVLVLSVSVLNHHLTHGLLRSRLELETLLRQEVTHSVSGEKRTEQQSWERGARIGLLLEILYGDNGEKNSVRYIGPKA